MVRFAEQCVKLGRPWYLPLLALVLVGCYYPGAQEEQAAVESHESRAARANTLYLDVSFDGSTYQLIQAHISDTVFTRGPIIYIYGIYGVQVLAEHNAVSFEQYTWMEPINGRIRLPFSDGTAFIEFIHRIKDEKFVIGRFTRADILSAAS